MPEILEFDILYEYSLLKVGITLETILTSGDFRVDVEARIDTGSTFCVFERHHGEGLEFGN